ncbi:MAG: response regulator, partial [Phototrophicaceae bacterium]
NKDNRDLLVRMLERADYTVIAVGDATEALNMMKATPIHIMLIDINLPYIDGFEFLKMVHNIPELADVPTIAITASAMRASRPICLQAGFDDYLTKPITRRELLQVVEQQLNKVSSM